jgi:hypothetical protein
MTSTLQAWAGEHSDFEGRLDPRTNSSPVDEYRSLFLLNNLLLYPRNGSRQVRVTFLGGSPLEL